MMKKIIAVLMALMMLVSAAALAEETTEAAEDPVLVTVNGQELRESSEEYRIWLDIILNDAGTDSEEYMTLIQQYALDYAVRYAAMEQKLNEMGKGMPEEDANAGAEAAHAEWNEIVEQYMQNLYGVSADASDEDKAAAKADAQAYILENYGYTEDVYVDEATMYSRLNVFWSNGREMAAEGIEVTDQEVEDYFKAIVEEDEAFFMDLIQPQEGEEVSEEKMKEELVQAYEFYTQYYGYESSFRPEGYRGITHILLGVEQELLDKWQELTAKLEEQDEEEEVLPEAEDTETETEAAEPTAEPEEPVTPEMVEAARQAILDSVKDTLAEINQKLADGASFEDLILEYGKDPGMQDDATRAAGYAVHPYSIMYDQNFMKGVAALQAVGDISDPVVSQFGVHILHYLRDIPGGAEELTDSLKEELRATLLDEKVGAAFDELQEKWVAESEIVWTEAGESWKIDVDALMADETETEPAEQTEAVPAE